MYASLLLCRYLKLCDAQVWQKDPLMQKGMDSLGALELRNNIQTRFGLEVPATIIFHHPNIESLADYIKDRMSPIQARTFYNATQGPSTKHVSVKRTFTTRRLHVDYMLSFFRLRKATGILYPCNKKLHAGMQEKEQSSKDIKRKLQEIAKVILGVDVSPQQPLMEAGLDSLAATEMHNAISKSFVEHEVPATFVFDFPTIDAMVQYFVVNYGDTNTIVVPVAVEGTPGPFSQSSEIVGVSCRYPNGGYGKTNLHCLILAWKPIHGMFVKVVGDG